MLLSVLALLALLGFVFYVMNAEERTHSIRLVRTFLEGDPQHDRFLIGLRERTRRALVTPALAALNTLMCLLMLWGLLTSGAPDTLLAWGGNYGPRTTNGEWGRLVRAMFLHGNLFHLLVNVAALFQLGLVVERLIGPFIFVSVYFAAGILANLISLYQDPLAMSVGSSGAIFGIYGLLVSAYAWAVVDDSSLKISRATLRRLAPAAAIFALCNIATASLSFTAEIGGLIVGIVLGGVLTRGAGESSLSLQRIASTAGAVVLIVIVAAIPLRGVDDVRSEIEQVVAVEERTAATYEGALDRFRKGRMSAESLALLIDKAIIPELQATDALLKTVDKVPPEYRSLMASAENYVRLRQESWRLRAEGLRKMGKVVDSGRAEGANDDESLVPSVTIKLRQAESKERDALDAFHALKPANR
jgi:rhomboid protease GluP